MQSQSDGSGHGQIVGMCEEVHKTQFTVKVRGDVIRGLRSHKIIQHGEEIRVFGLPDCFLTLTPHRKVLVNVSKTLEH